ncbi:MAG: coenzyme F420-0:L-glutamate ligase [Patescibacteria group bacterium]
MRIKALKTAIFRPREKLLPFIDRHIGKLAEGDILVITSKIVALAEGRFQPLTTKDEKERLIRSESEFALPTKLAYLTIKDGIVMASAGVDESNGNGNIIMLPRDSFKVARTIRRYFQGRFKLKKLGVIITDSRTAPLRAGITGVALGYAGFKGIKDYRRTLDIFGRPFHFSRVDMADSLAAAAVLCMGEGRERRPLAIISGAPVEYVERVSRDELRIDIKEDMYGPLFHQFQ